MKVIVTCGPSYEPIDQVRRLTNFSTGELGVQLCDGLTQAGFEVFCLKGGGSTYPGPGEQCHLHQFNTNDDLLALLSQLSASHDIAAVFHVAALCDYKVARVEDEQGRSCTSPKIASRSGALTISLKPATKVIAEMRRLFPESILLGWKYELAGTRQEAFAKARRQAEENRTDACVLNGQAYGPGFAFCRPSSPIHECGSKAELIQCLTNWLHEKLFCTLGHTYIKAGPRFPLRLARFQKLPFHESLKVLRAVCAGEEYVALTHAFVSRNGMILVHAPERISQLCNRRMRDDWDIQSSRSSLAHSRDRMPP